METDTRREKALSDYRKKLLEHRELDARLKESKAIFLVSFFINFCLLQIIFFIISHYKIISFCNFFDLLFFSEKNKRMI